MAAAYFSPHPSQHMMNYTPSRQHGHNMDLETMQQEHNAGSALIMSKLPTEMTPLNALLNARQGKGLPPPGGEVVPATGPTTGPNNIGPNEADLLRRTLIDLLVENEQLRTALQVNHPSGQEHHAGDRAQHMSSALSGRQEPNLSNQMPTRVGRSSVEARRAAVARFQDKKKRRLLAMTQGPRYVKMKAVADGKKRNSSGKFVKKGDQILVVTPPVVTAAVDAELAVPQIMEVQIEPRFDEPAEK